MSNILSGIYQLYFKDNIGKKYIGCSIDINRRYSGHCTALKGGYHHNHLLQHDYTYIYKEVPNMLIMEECAYEEFNEKEKNYIRAYNTFNSSKGYNLTAGGELASMDNTGNHFNASHNESIYLEILNLLANTSYTHKEIAISLNVHKRVVDSVKEAANHKYLKTKYPELWEKMLKVRNPLIKAQVICPKGVVYDIIKGKGNAFARENGLDGNSLNAVIRGDLNHTKGWKLWKPREVVSE